MHTSPRVLQLGPLYNNHLRRWSQHAVTIGCTVCAAGDVRPGRRPLDLSGIADAVEVAPEELNGTEGEAHAAWLRSVVDRLQPDVIQAHFLFRWPYIAALAGSRPLVVTPWGSDLYLVTGERRRQADYALRHADAVIARSPHMRRELLTRGVPADRVLDADLGVDLERFSPGPEAANARPPVILSFRAGTEIYNLDLVLDAFRIVRGRLPEARLVLVHGDAPLAEPVQARVDELARTGAVEIRGHVSHEEMPGHMRAAAVGVSVPRSDGSPSSVWEALATGLPLVLSDLPQLRERLGDSSGALFVKPRADAIAAALIDVLAHPERRRRMATAARAWAESNVDERRQADRLSAVYSRFAGRDRATAAGLPRRPS